MPRADPQRVVALALALALALLAGCASPTAEAPDNGSAAPEAAPSVTDEGHAPAPSGSGPALPLPEAAEGAGPDEDAGEDADGAQPGRTAGPDDGGLAAPLPATRAALTAGLEALVAEVERRAPGLSWGVLVTDELGREVVAHGADEPQLPASTAKQVTAAAILTTLGPRARLTTRVEATAGIDADGVLDGDLVLVGGGDPTLTTPAYARGVLPARPRSSIDDLAAQLADQGLTRVTGDLRGTAPGFDDDPLPQGWPDRYLSAFDGRHIAGLTVDAGLRTLERFPEARLRDPEERTGPEDDDGVDADDDGADDDADADDGPDEAAWEAFADAVGLDRVPTSLTQVDPDDVDLTSVDPDVLRDLHPAIVDLGPVDVRIEHATDPVRHASDELRRALERRDVTIDGEVATGAPDAPILARLAAVESPTVADLLRFTVQRSDNHLADTLFQVAGRTRTGAGTWERSERALQQVLERFGVDPTGSVFADGSGLSRDDRLTPRQLVELDRVLTSSPRWSTVWRALQAEAGVSGTLERRLRGTVAQGRFLGKTGTLRDVTALTGQVTSMDRAAGPVAGERRYHLAVLATDTDVVGRGAARAATDELILTLVADLDGCAVRTPSEGDGPLGRAPRTVAC